MVFFEREGQFSLVIDNENIQIVTIQSFSKITEYLRRQTSVNVDLKINLKKYFYASKFNAANIHNLHHRMFLLYPTNEIFPYFERTTLHHITQNTITCTYITRLWNIHYKSFRIYITRVYGFFELTSQDYKICITRY